ncbi:MAG: glycosyltransferase family 39 protein [Candidatus Lernaella stagnicola]|nr:glycosyltransferase family 39 protein [Candidatus Lernaella stagnicola]
MSEHSTAAPLKDSGLNAYRAALALAALLTQGAILWGDFYLDDYFYLHLARAGAPVWAFFTQDLWFGLYYRPAFYFFFKPLYGLFGAHAVGYLAVNLALVAATTCLLFELGRRWFGSIPVAFWTAALFAVSPATTMGAHFVFNTPDVLGAFFLVVSLIAFWRWMDGRRRLWLTASLLAALAAMLCKENQIVVALLVFPLAFSFHRQRGESRRRAAGLTLLTAWPWVLAASLYFVWRWLFLGGFGGYDPLPGAPPLDVILPVIPKLIADYFPVLPWLLPPLAVGILALLIWGRRTGAPRLALMGLALFVLAMAPMAVNLKNPVMALWFPLRFFYLGGFGAGLLLAAAAGLAGRPGRVARLLLAGLAILLAVNSAVLGWNFSRWQTRRAESLQQTADNIARDHGDAEPGTVLYYCARPHDHALDTAVKFYRPELTDRLLVLHCNDRTEFVASGGLMRRLAVEPFYDPMLKRNPIRYGDLTYGIVLTTLRQVNLDARRNERVRVVVPPEEIDPLTDRFFPFGAGRRYKPPGY